LSTSEAQKAHDATERAVQDAFHQHPVPRWLRRLWQQRMDEQPEVVYPTPEELRSINEERERAGFPPVVLKT
jgi:hypothetical protein